MPEIWQTLFIRPRQDLREPNLFLAPARVGGLAIKALQEAGLQRELRGSTRPQYRLLPWAEQEGRRKPERRPMTERGRAIRELVAAGEQPTGTDKHVAYHLVGGGWLVKDERGQFEIAPKPAGDPLDWIWLPNSLVVGAQVEVPPVELVRQTQDVMTLRMLVDFYHAQNLREDGGRRLSG